MDPCILHQELVLHAPVILMIVWKQNIHYASLTAMFNPLHSSIDQELLGKHICKGWSIQFSGVQRVLFFLLIFQSVLLIHHGCMYSRINTHKNTHTIWSFYVSFNAFKTTTVLVLLDILRCTSADTGFPYGQPKTVTTMWCQQTSTHKTKPPMSNSIPKPTTTLSASGKQKKHPV